MSRSYTKHPFPCTHFCKKGNSKKGKILAKCFNEKFDFNKIVNEWKKYFYRK